MSKRVKTMCRVHSSRNWWQCSQIFALSHSPKSLQSPFFRTANGGRIINIRITSSSISRVKMIDWLNSNHQVALLSGLAPIQYLATSWKTLRCTKKLMKINSIALLATNYTIAMYNYHALLTLLMLGVVL